MDVATPVGIIVAFAAIIVSMIMDKGDPMSLVSEPAPMVLVLVGTFGTALAGNRLADLGAIVKSALRALLAKGSADPRATVAQLVEFADVARREGLLALEQRAQEVEDPFLRRALDLVVDGTDSEALEEILGTELDAMRRRHTVGAKFFQDMAGFSPTLGILGTVIGLIHTLHNLNDPGQLGPLIASAFLATLWGVMMANVVWMPIANKLKRASAVEMAQKELVVSGVLSLQSGVSPRVLGERLKGQLAPRLRDTQPGKAQDKSAEKISA